MWVGKYILNEINEVYKRWGKFRIFVWHTEWVGKNIFNEIILSNVSTLGFIEGNLMNLELSFLFVRYLDFQWSFLFENSSTRWFKVFANDFSTFQFYNWIPKIKCQTK